MADLTTVQKQALKAAILADSTMAAQVAANDFQSVADTLSAPAVPAFIVWKTSVSIPQVGDAINSAELGGLSTLNSTRLQTIATFHPSGFNPSISNVRAFFDDIFSGAGGVNTRAALLALWKRSALLAEKILKASGTGSDASPATLGYEGGITVFQIGPILAS